MATVSRFTEEEPFKEEELPVSQDISFRTSFIPARIKYSVYIVVTSKERRLTGASLHFLAHLLNTLR